MKTNFFYFFYIFFCNISEKTKYFNIGFVSLGFFKIKKYNIIYYNNTLGLDPAQSGQADSSPKEDGPQPAQ